MNNLRYIAFFVALLMTSTLTAQEPQWQKLYSIPVDSNVVWSVDISDQLYIFQKQSMSKWSVSGKKMLEQSIKQLGDISSIDANNQLKIAVFSEQQQQVCYLDNALALTNDCIELIDFNVEWAYLFAGSNQTDRFWIYDQVNNELKLLSTAEQQQQVVQNLKQLANLSTPKLLFERNNNLFIIDENNVLAQFDIYGTLVNTFELGAADHFFSSDQVLYGIQGNTLYRLFDYKHSIAERVSVIQLPEDIGASPVVQAKSGTNCFFIATQTELSVFRLKQ